MCGLDMLKRDIVHLGHWQIIPSDIREGMQAVFSRLAEEGRITPQQALHLRRGAFAEYLRAARVISIKEHMRVAPAILQALAPYAPMQLGDVRMPYTRRLARDLERFYKVEDAPRLLA